MEDTLENRVANLKRGEKIVLDAGNPAHQQFVMNMLAARNANVMQTTAVQGADTLNLTSEPIKTLADLEQIASAEAKRARKALRK